MSEVEFGEIDWNSGDVAGSEGGKVEFMKIEEGKSVVRVMGNPHQYYIHWLETAQGKKTKVNSPAGHPALLKKIEDAGFKRKARWIVKVLDRKDNKFKLLEIGTQIYSGIKVLFNNPKWGNPSGYDITIERGPAGSQPLYRVTPDPKEPLSSQEKQQFLEFNERVDITKYTEPTDPAKIVEFMGWKSDGSRQQSMQSKKPRVEESDDSDDQYFNFKS